MPWNVQSTDEFAAWLVTLEEEEQDALARSIGLLQEYGPQLARPHADSLAGSRHANMKELRTQVAGRPLRTFFAFDPLRSAVLLIGGDKTGDRRFYDRMVPRADRLYDEWLDALRNEGLI